MDNFSIQVDKEDIQPLLTGFEEKFPFVDLEYAQFFLYRIPYQQQSEEEHVRRLETLKKIRSKEILRLRKNLNRERALPVVKIKFGGRSYIVKPTHSQVSPKLFDHSEENPRFEIYLSELASKLGIGPKLYAGYYFNPRMLMMTEECISEDNGWEAMYKHIGKLDLKLFPRKLGEMIGQIHRLHEWKTSDGREEHKGHIWYKDRVLLHLFYNRRNDSLRLVDFGNAELISPERLAKDKHPRRKLLGEVEEVAKNLIKYVFYYKKGIRRENAIEYKQILSEFGNAYSKETGINIKISDLMRSIKSKI